MISDLNHAASLGYTVLEWFEIYQYENEGLIFKDFMKTLFREKIMASGYPEFQSYDEKKEFCDKINTALELDKTCEIKPEHVKKDAVKRKCIKTAMNSLLGKSKDNNSYCSLF